MAWRTLMTPILPVAPDAVEAPPWAQTAGVQNTKREERLTFDRLEPFAGEWISGEGEFTDADGVTKRVGVAIGPEHGTVGPLQVKEAAKEAAKEAPKKAEKPAAGRTRKTG